MLVAGVAAAAIFLIAIGIATSGSGTAVSARLERYASARKDKAAATTGQGGIQRPARPERRPSPQLNKVVEQRDFGANLARDIARADLKLKPSEFLAIWAVSIIGIPLAMRRVLRSACRPSATRCSSSSARSSASCCRGSG